MRLLLDTHIWLWSLREAHRVRPRVMRELRSEGNQLWLSPISTWEALVLHAKGKITLHADVDSWIRAAVLPFHEAPLTHEIVVAAQQLSLPRAHPADRFLAATAKVLGLTLVTADRRLLALPDIPTLANR